MKNQKMDFYKTIAKSERSKAGQRASLRNASKKSNPGTDLCRSKLRPSFNHGGALAQTSDRTTFMQRRYPVHPLLAGAQFRRAEERAARAGSGRFPAGGGARER